MIFSSRGESTANSIKKKWCPCVVKGVSLHCKKDHQPLLWTVHMDGTWEDASSSAIIASLCTIPGGGRGRPRRPGSRGGCVGGRGRRWMLLLFISKSFFQKCVHIPIDVRAAALQLLQPLLHLPGPLPVLPGGGGWRRQQQQVVALGGVGLCMMHGIAIFLLKTLLYACMKGSCHLQVEQGIYRLLEKVENNYCLCSCVQYLLCTSLGPSCWTIFEPSTSRCLTE